MKALLGAAVALAFTGVAWAGNTSNNTSNNTSTNTSSDPWSSNSSSNQSSNDSGWRGWVRDRRVDDRYDERGGVFVHDRERWRRDEAWGWRETRDGREDDHD
jgi:hypothetical protein